MGGEWVLDVAGASRKSRVEFCHLNLRSWNISAKRNQHANPKDESELCPDLGNEQIKGGHFAPKLPRPIYPHPPPRKTKGAA